MSIHTYYLVKVEVDPPKADSVKASRDVVQSKLASLSWKFKVEGGNVTASVSEVKRLIG